ncbi:rad17 cell cycle checkpoint protein domain-containing protein [Ditylenchus destructor]|uniref:Rad17 cell cycle checkpoint protein domain-containing protein n=1 Tax=Ditylenchus destructor TaxID=166010 RepID=A0AAD4N7N8_9BILA|nr:rad17 cell cycle checkpoint protein domain-containing protein [Ditylenchus destructor]
MSTSRKRNMPQEEEDLVIQPKKLQELKHWLRCQMPVERGPKNLLLTGPSGCGKSTAIRVLCSELGIEVMEFEGSQEYYINEFDGRICAKSMFHMLKQFFLRAQLSSISKMSLKHRLLLIRQLPLIFYRDFKLWRNFLQKYTTSSRCIIAFVPSTIETSRELNSSRLFTADILDQFRIHNIKFNAIAATQMTKFMKGLSLGGSQKVQQNLVKEVVKLANGDFRKALTVFDYFANGQPSVNENIPLPNTPNFELFHYIGKIMYAKRATETNERWEKSEEMLRKNAQRFMRALPPKEDLNELTSVGFVSGEFVNEYIFEHEPNFAPSVPALAYVTSNLAAFDEYYSYSAESDIMDKYLLEVSIRSTVFHNCGNSGLLFPFNLNIE